MAFRDVQLANEQLSKVLREADIPNLQGQVDVDATDRKGLGSFGEVYVGQYDGISVCVKILRAIPFTEDRQWGKFLRRLKREVTVWHQALHPNVVALLGWTSQVEKENIRVSLISVWCDGGSVKDYLRRNPIANRHALIKDVCRGLAYLHSRGIVHGDIKPANIVVVGRTGQARLCDFGLSSLLGDPSTSTESTSTFGTIRFLSPELLTGKLHARNEGSDVWAFGCASGEILCDERPYHWIINDWLVTPAVPKGPPYIWPDRDGFVKCIASCCEIDPERRPTSSELAEVLSHPNPTIASLQMLLNVLQLDHLPLDWRYKPKENIPELVPEFNKTRPPFLQYICREWCDIVLDFPSSDPEILTTFTPVLLHWVAAMGIMGELNRALRGLYDLHKRAEDHSLKAHLYDIYRITLQSREAIIACPLSLLGGCHPFVPESVLRSVFHATSMKSPRGRIHFFEPSTNKSWAVFIIPDSDQPRFSPQGRHLVIFSRNMKKGVFVRDLVTGNTSNLGFDKDYVSHVAFSPDCGYVAFSTNRNVYVRQWEAGGIDRVGLKEDFRKGGEIAFSPDGQYLACHSDDGDICIWNVADWMSRVLRSGILSDCSIAFSPDNRHIALSTSDGGSIWDIAAQPMARVRAVKADSVVVFSPDGQFVASVNDRSVHFWKVSTWTKDFTFEHPDKVGAVAFSPQGQQLASCLYNGTITIWDLMTQVASSVFEGKGGRQRSFQLKFSPDGRHLACYLDGNVRVWDVGNKTISTKTLLEHVPDVSYLEFSPDGCYLAVAFGGKCVGMLDLSIGTRQTILAGPKGVVDCVAFSPNGSQLVSLCSSSVYVWNTETWARDEAEQCTGTWVEFSNDGRLIVIGQPWYPNEYLDASTFRKVDPPGSWVPADVTAFPAPRFPVFLSDDKRSLCLQKGNQIIHFCWFPDSFVARSEVAQYRDMVCIGGQHGEVLWIDLAGFEVPDI